MVLFTYTGTVEARCSTQLGLKISLFHPNQVTTYSYYSTYMKLGTFWNEHSTSHVTKHDSECISENKFFTTLCGTLADERLLCLEYMWFILCALIVHCLLFHMIIDDLNGMRRTFVLAVRFLQTSSTQAQSQVPVKANLEKNDNLSIGATEPRTTRNDCKHHTVEFLIEEEGYSSSCNK